MNIDPVIGQTRTKIGETGGHTNDPVIGKTRTKIGETASHVNDYGSPYFNSSYQSYPTNYAYARPRTYTHASPDSGVGAAIVCLFALFVVAAIITSPTPSPSYRSSTPGLGRPNLYNPYRAQSSVRWKCDVIEYCDEHLSGARSNCHLRKENCGYRFI